MKVYSERLDLHASDCPADHGSVGPGSAACRACGCGGPAALAVGDKVMADISRRALLVGAAAAIVSPYLDLHATSAFAAEPKRSDRPLLLTNLRLFDGRGGLRENVSILVEGNRIAGLPGADERVEGAEVIDCGGRLAMPGLIDAHWHTMLCGITELAAMTSDVGYLYLVAGQEAERTLMRGFTSVRDAGGPSFALKQAIDQGIVQGPRIYPSGAMISQTSGHGDFRMRHEVPAGLDDISYGERVGLAAIADGRAQVLKRVREQLMLGASQIKLMAGGGVTSSYDPIDTLQYTEEELRAGVEAAEDWNTYVMVHVYTPRGIKRALRAGVRSIEHGQLADEEAVRMMADEGAWWSLQPFLADVDANIKTGPDAKAKQEEVARGTVRAYEMAKQFDVNTAWGTDILFSPQNLPTQGRQLAKLTPRFYEPLELLATATGRNGELLGLSGPRNPYDGKLGVIEPGALADILVADGDPTESLDFLSDPDANLRIIMKDGRIYKDTRS
ncbi:metal-dependent hydrolase family protein [Amorphus orientalis]|uniref:Imidazolonepropionase-like amidohydrolase n=1 Tax=Amorphus orientalis TaxID=649198 RepID=A0AAE3VT78_9HYPH|nr:amidohydrolase family protein [Amorphus orientalis]MDQ0317395.1 imidazolonepropionase-like amidohydrolase [Amorphus orientalis]